MPAQTNEIATPLDVPKKARSKYIKNYSKITCEVGRLMRFAGDQKDPHLIAGAAGVAATLGSDFVKVNYPAKAGHESPQTFREAVQAAGRTKVVCAGGESTESRLFLQRLHDQIHISGAAGNATGRNIHQRPLAEAVRLCNAIYAITVENAGVDAACKIYKGN